MEKITKQELVNYVCIRYGILDAKQAKKKVLEVFWVDMHRFAVYKCVKHCYAKWNNKIRFALHFKAFLYLAFGYIWH